MNTLPAYAFELGKGIFNGMPSFLFNKKKLPSLNPPQLSTPIHFHLFGVY